MFITSSGRGNWYMAGVHAMQDGLQMMQGAAKAAALAGKPSREEFEAYIEGYLTCRRVVKGKEEALTPSPSPARRGE